MGSAKRFARYLTFKLILLFITTVIGVYITILVANMGGYVDKLRMSQLREEIGMKIMRDPSLRNVPTTQKKKMIEEKVRLEAERLGLDKPFLIRSLYFLRDAMTLNLGRAQFMVSDSGSRQVKAIILERLPPTLLLMGTSFFLIFFLNLFIGLALSRQYGSWLDKIYITMAPLSAAPAWFYGIFLILVFAAWLGWLPFGGMVDAPKPPTAWLYALNVAKHMILPLGAMLLSSHFIGVYGNRTFFLIYSSEDYVDLARAKGLPARMLERRYILRPTLPTIVTNFLLSVITLWMGAIIFETVFNWPGNGRLYYQAIGMKDVPVIVGNTIIYAYLLAISVFLLDITYALLDPRVRVGSSHQG